MPCGRGWGGWSCRTGGATGYRWCVGPTRHFFWCHGLRIAWIIAGDEIGGVAQAVRGLTKAVPAQGIEPLFISLADGPFVEELRARGHTVAVLGNFHFPVLQGSFGEKLATLPAMQQATASTLHQNLLDAGVAYDGGHGDDAIRKGDEAKVAGGQQAGQNNLRAKAEDFRSDRLHQHPEKAVCGLVG